MSDFSKFITVVISAAIAFSLLMNIIMTNKFDIIIPKERWHCTETSIIKEEAQCITYQYKQKGENK